MKVNQNELSPEELQEFMDILTLKRRAKEYSQAQIALICIYNGRKVNRLNAKRIAESYGHSSSQNLYGKYIKYRNSLDRTALDSKRVLKFKIRLIESVIPKIQKTKRPKVKEELRILKEKYEKHFG